MTTIISATEPGEFLRVIPTMLGYTPTDSILLIPFRGTRSAGGMRFDFPEHDLDAAAATMTGLACRVPDIDGVTLVVYRDAPHDASDDEVVEALRSRLDACGLRLHDALRVVDDTWTSLLDPEQSGGIGGAIAVDGFAAPTGDQHTGAELPAADDGRASAITAGYTALTEVLAALDDASRTPPALSALPPLALGALDALTEPNALFEEALRLDPDDPDPTHALALTWLLAAPAYRSVALVQWATDLRTGRRALAEEGAWQAGGTISHAIGEILWGSGPTPSPERLERAQRIVLRLASEAPEQARASALSVAAWLAWARGRASLAADLAEAALRIDPDVALGEIVATLVSAAHMPEWAFSGRAATSRAGRGSSRGSRGR